MKSKEERNGSKKGAGRKGWRSRREKERKDRGMRTRRQGSERRKGGEGREGKRGESDRREPGTGEGEEEAERTCGRQVFRTWPALHPGCPGSRPLGAASASQWGLLFRGSGLGAFYLSLYPPVYYLPKKKLFPFWGKENISIPRKVELINCGRQLVTCPVDRQTDMHTCICMHTCTLA